MTKEQALLALAKKRQTTRYDGYTSIGDYNGGVWECDYVSPYSKSAHNVDARVMAVLQDWCSSDAFTGDICVEDLSLGYDSTAKTNISLMTLLQNHFGLSLQDTYTTNLFPYIKPGAMNALISIKDLTRAAKDFTLPMVEIIQPQLVICFGKNTFNVMRRACGMGDTNNVAEAIDSSFQYRGATLCCQSHPGQLGKNNRNKGGVDRASADWQRLKTVLDENKIEKPSSDVLSPSTNKTNIMTAKKHTGFIQWFGPLLNALRDLGDSGRPREVSAKIAENLKLPDTILDASFKSGTQKFHNQVCWARQYLVWAGFLDSSIHGTWKLTEKGQGAHLSVDEAAALTRKWKAIHQERRKQRPSAEHPEAEEIENFPQPENDLLTVLRSISPTGFEKVTRELLRESGFEKVEITGGSADEGIDGYGVLALNPFVSFKVIFQCKRYQEGNNVGRVQVADLRNSMLGRAEKGIIITTSTFTQAALKEANRDGAATIELVDGEKLVEMFQKVQLGLTQRVVYDIDQEYFAKYAE
ncbi:restriction endonuclease [Desulfotalea psychrophila]|uniref:Related to Mrr restriction system protein n=1 Tax=Desulfotalea psychrophila (strain LSv54 / DSM 12343) TaxID=177439 RepID=Q6ALL1_DESPS|nr:restriction endonuclease [Desulfotalea psychrophila]CAG36764.1 related to Mrr restriction system protein [Desulfotalea psychrophila LSv54]